jgi:hypothetical protein
VAQGRLLGPADRAEGLKHFIPATLGGSAAANSLLIGACDGVTVCDALFYLRVQMVTVRAPDRGAGVLAEAVATGAAPVMLRDRRQHLRELPGLAVGLEFLRRDQIAGLVDVTLEQSVSHR